MATAGRDRPPTNEDSRLVTGCGRRIAVRCLRLAPAALPLAPGRQTIGPVEDARIRDTALEPGDGPAESELERLRRRVRRSWTLRWSLRGVRRLSDEDALVFTSQVLIASASRCKRRRSTL